jgi:uncharacterized protein (DUF1501 family)
MNPVPSLSVSRRFFLKQGALAFASIGAGAMLGPAFLRASALQGEGGKSAGGRRVLVCVFQRGAVDGLSMVAPCGEAAYYRWRREIALAGPGGQRGGEGALDLDGFFGLHPAMADLHPLFGAGELAVVHACGNPGGNRSHFESQDLMEAGTASDRKLATGWLNRMIGTCPEDASRRSALRAVALASQLPRSLHGPEEALAVADLGRFGVGGGSGPAMGGMMGGMMGGGMGGAAGGFEQLYATAVGDALHGAGQDGFAAMELLRGLDPRRYRPAHGAEYPAAAFGRSLRQVAQLIKADVGLEVAFVEIGGWDTHVNQGAASGVLANRLNELSRGLAAFHRDLGPMITYVLVLTMI